MKTLSRYIFVTLILHKAIPKEIKTTVVGCTLTEVFTEVIQLLISLTGMEQGMCDLLGKA